MSGETPAAGVTPAATTPNPTDPNTTPGQTPAASETLDFKDWLAQQPDNIKSLITGHTQGQQSALRSEREARSKAERDLKDLQAKLEQGTATAQDVQAIRNSLNEKDAELTFYDAAHAAGATNLKRVFTLVKNEGLIDGRGHYDMEKIKAAFPEYFPVPVRPTTPTGNAGSGAGNQPPALSGNAAVNNALRSAAGFRS